MGPRKAQSSRSNGLYMTRQVAQVSASELEYLLLKTRYRVTHIAVATA
jgi:hypothetical protein